MTSQSTSAVTVGEDETTDDRSRMSFLEHLDELRRRLVYSAYVLVGCCAVTLYFWEPIFNFFVVYFGQFGAAGGQLVYTKPMAGFLFSLKVSALAGLGVASPFLFTQLWLFIAPGLYAKEKRVVVPFVFFASVLFFMGAYFAHQVAFKAMWNFFGTYQRPGQLTFLPNLDDAFSIYVWTVLGLGIVFQMPMLTFFMARFGVITAGFMIRKFKFAVLGMVVIAAVITPTGDAVTLALFVGPMLVLYVISIGVAWLFGKKRPKELEA